jgi:uncharacterized protein
MHARPSSITPTRTAILLWIFAAAFTPLAIGDEPAPPSIVVYGTAEAQVTPDRMVWRIRIHNKGSKVATVAAEHATMVRAALGFLKQNGLEGADVQTSLMRFGENQEYRNGSWIKDGYCADTEASFKLTDFNKYDVLWIGLAELAGVSVDSVVFEHSKRVDYQNDTRRKALLAARDKAADLAHTLGVELGEPLHVEEDFSLQPARTANYIQAQVMEVHEPSGWGAADDTLAPGTISIRTRVCATFRLISPVAGIANPSEKEQS